MDTKAQVSLQTRGSEVPICSTVGKMAGGEMKLLPGESRAAYREGLEKTIAELGATTHLQVYFAEKIFDCVWWLRRLESQKTGILLNRVVKILDEYLGAGTFRGVIENQDWDDRVLKKTLIAAGLSLNSVMAEAARLERDVMRSLDQQTTEWVRTLQKLQSSYEGLVNRKIFRERLELQNASLRRDLGALEMSPVQQPAAPSSESSES